ncbi:MAG: hypothetical protein JSS32_06430 [Verrucomicrobia bacterium]|nr:hypothetical protein [Verrucomicrobiota bacterium]
MSAISESPEVLAWPPEEDWVQNLSFSLFRAASYLTDPICKAHELYRRVQIIDKLDAKATQISRLIQKIAFCAGIVGAFVLALITSLPGMLLRGLAAQIQQTSYTHFQFGPGKPIPEEGFTLLSWNICCTGGGYSISDGGVVPWADRIDAIADQILEADADVNCIYETFDFHSAYYLMMRLREKGYVDFYFNIGPQAVGVTSGIFVASKCKLDNVEFDRFPKDSLVGRTKAAAKGVFSFDLGDAARIFTTHLQHSEEPQFPTPDEVKARKQQMEIIVKKVDQIKDRCVVVTGDLNLDDDEYQASFWKDRFVKGKEYDEFTWGGDESCALLVGNKRVSKPLNLDHTMILKGSAQSIRTKLIETDYDPKIFKKSARSDHRGELSHIVFNRAV